MTKDIDIMAFDADHLHKMANSIEKNGIITLIDNGDQLPRAMVLMAQALRFVAAFKDRIDTDRDW